MSAHTFPHRLRRDISDIVERYWSDYAIERTKSDHVSVTLRYKDLSCRIFTSGTPSDPRSWKNFEAQVRRKVRELKSSEHGQSS